MPAKSMSSSRQTTVKGYNLELSGNSLHLNAGGSNISVKV